VSAWRQNGDVKETRLDQALRTWPDIRRNKREWAEFAARMPGGASSRHPGWSLDSISDDDLLGSPLPQTEEESHKCRHFSGETREAEAGIMGQQNIERDRKTFRDLAQLASQPALQRGSISEIRSSQRDVTGHAKGGDSGLIDFGTLGQPERGSVDRASVTPLASTDLADAEDAPTRPKISVTPPPLPASVPPPRSSVPAPAPSARAIHTPLAISASQRAPLIQPMLSAQAALLAAEPEPSRGFGGRVVALLGIAAVAAGAFLVVRTLRAPNAQGEHIVVSTAAAAAPHAPLVAPAPTPTPAADRGIDPMSLPQAASLNAQPVVIATGGHHVHHHHGLAKSGAPAPGTANDDADDSDDSTASAPAAPVAAAAPAPAPKVDATPAAAAPPAKAAPTPAWLQGALGEAITKAAAPAAPAAPAADPAPAAAAPVPVPASAPVAAAGSVPQHPSQGAVTSALSGALPSARACLGPDDDVSRVRVVFGSDGAVQSMTVTGFAAGKPQEACIKGALGKAHVPPFAEATYGANVNGRP
jgi:hypothetical protein